MVAITASSAAFLLAFFATTTIANPVYKRADAFKIAADNGSSDKCLGIDLAPKDGNQVTLFPCDSIGKDKVVGAWEIVHGNNANGIKLSGTNFCLDAGSDVNAPGYFKLWTCYPGAPQQTYYYTDDNHIAITGASHCVDKDAGSCGRYGCLPGYALCSSPTGPTSQSWSLLPVGGTSPPPPTNGGGQVHPNGDTIKCVRGGDIGNIKPGISPFVGTCVSGGPNIVNQIIQISRGQGAVKFASSNLCLDTGSNPQNGALAKLETCNGGPTQDFWYTAPGDDHIAITGGTLCLDLKKEDGVTLQYWACDGHNSQQKFTI